MTSMFYLSDQKPWRLQSSIPKFLSFLHVGVVNLMLVLDISDTHSTLFISQIVATQNLGVPLRELRRLVRLRLREARDVTGFNIAALKAVGKVASDRRATYFVPEASENVWAGLGLGSDVAAALESKGKSRKHKTAATKFR